MLKRVLDHRWSVMEWQASDRSTPPPEPPGPEFTIPNLSPPDPELRRFFFSPPRPPNLSLEEVVVTVVVAVAVAVAVAVVVAVVVGAFLIAREGLCVGPQMLQFL